MSEHLNVIRRVRKMGLLFLPFMVTFAYEHINFIRLLPNWIEIFLHKLHFDNLSDGRCKCYTWNEIELIEG